MKIDQRTDAEAVKAEAIVPTAFSRVLAPTLRAKIAAAYDGRSRVDSHRATKRRAWALALAAGWLAALWGWSSLIVGVGNPWLALCALFGGSCLGFVAMVQRAPYLPRQE